MKATIFSLDLNKYTAIGKWTRQDRSACIYLQQKTIMLTTIFITVDLPKPFIK